MTRHRGSSRRLCARHRFTSRLAAKLAWLAFCGYTLTGLSCPQVAVPEINRISHNAEGPAKRISDLASAINLTDCNADQRRAQGAAMRELLPYCRQIKFLEQQLGVIAQSIPRGDESEDMHDLRNKLEDASRKLESAETQCSVSFSTYNSCNPADAALLYAWYISTEAEIPPLPGYEQEPRGPAPAPPAAPPGYTPPGPG